MKKLLNKKLLTAAMLMHMLLLSGVIHAFSYQAELTQTGFLYTGSADLRFKLFDAQSNGNQVGSTDLHASVAIDNGRFVVQLDQWVGLYDGTPLWLEIDVDLNSLGSFTTLSPRQKLEPAPYAEFAYDGAGGNGDITGVTAGTGLTGGGVSGSVTLNVDGTIIQNRITGSCPAGQSIRSINQNGTVVCETDDDSGGDITGVTAGAGLTGGASSGNASLAVDTSTIQSRVISSCAAGQSIRVINQNGTVVCETDDNAGGDITAVNTSFGLTGGDVSGDITLKVNSSQVQTRVQQSCLAGQSIRAIDIDGQVICEIDDSFSGQYTDLIGAAWNFIGNNIYHLNKVGIGLENPISRLHVKTSGTDINGGLQLETSQATGEDWYVYMPISDNLQIRNDSVDVLTLAKDSGNIGIGTGSPSAKLEVNGQLKITGGTPGLNKILTSDANGLASWQEKTSGIDVGNYGVVVNPTTGKTWLDRDLGAIRVSQSGVDSSTQHHVFQWGRAEDGHEQRQSATTNTQATSWIADNGTNVWDGLFILSPNNWLNTNESDLWKGTDAENNPCPSGFRVPTIAEWNQERLSWSTQDKNGAFASPLRLSFGYSHANQFPNATVSGGDYWSSTNLAGSTSAYAIIIGNSSVNIVGRPKAYGLKVRCIKD